MKPSDIIKGMGFTPSDEQIFLMDSLLRVAVGEEAALNAPSESAVVKNSKKSPWITKVLKMGRSGSTATEIAAETKMTAANASRICRAAGVELRRTACGKVNEAMAGLVLALVEEGTHSDAKIAVQVGTSDSTVKAIRTGQHPIVGGNGRAEKK